MGEQIKASMSLDQQINGFAQKVGAECKRLLGKIQENKQLTDSEIQTLNQQISDLSDSLDEKETALRTLIANAKNEVKGELLGGAGEAYDSLKELADLILANGDAISALETISAGQVKFDSAQELTLEQKEVARANISAVSPEELSETASSIASAMVDELREEITGSAEGIATAESVRALGNRVDKNEADILALKETTSVDLSGYATKEQLETKADASVLQNLETEVVKTSVQTLSDEQKIQAKANIGITDIDVSNLIPKTGNRGLLNGYQRAGYVDNLGEAESVTVPSEAYDLTINEETGATELRVYVSKLPDITQIEMPAAQDIVGVGGVVSSHVLKIYPAKFWLDEQGEPIDTSSNWIKIIKLSAVGTFGIEFPQIEDDPNEAGSRFYWIDGEAPTIGAGDYIIILWDGTTGYMRKIMDTYSTIQNGRVS